MCKGRALEVHRLLKSAPDQPEFNDAKTFKFKMFHQNLNKNREEIFITPVALAVNIGDYSMLDAILKTLQNVNLDQGMQAKALNAPIIKNKEHKLLIRRTSPL